MSHQAIAVRLAEHLARGVSREAVRRALARLPERQPALVEIERTTRVETDPDQRRRAIARLEEAIDLGQRIVSGDLKIRSSAARARVYDSMIFACLELHDLAVEDQRAVLRGPDARG